VNLLCERIAAAFTASCRDELDAPKPGNVHVLSPAGRKSPDDFLRSAEAAAAQLTVPRARVGRRIFAAVEAARAAVGHNTNLGIILLCAPLAAAAELRAADLREALARVLRELDVADAELAFRAIVAAAPGGLGRAERHDVFGPAHVTLRQAMAEAADRDRIARQYVSDFDDVFGLGEPVLRAARARGSERKWATLAVFLGFASAFCDSHIVREHGAETAEEVRRTAAHLRKRLDAARDPGEILPELLAYDRSLKQRSVNPGTSADLTVATLFANRLRNILPSACNND
jgi:triphosphoribosyl-dephospho-CoA synthase